jgi:hypothetical protein
LEAVVQDPEKAVGEVSGGGGISVALLAASVIVGAGAGSVAGLNAQAHQLQEAGVDDGALVDLVGVVVAEVVGGAPVGLAVFGEPQVVGLIGERSGAGGPSTYLSWIASGRRL